MVVVSAWTGVGILRLYLDVWFASLSVPDHSKQQRPESLIP